MEPKSKQHQFADDIDVGDGAHAQPGRAQVTGNGPPGPTTVDAKIDAARDGTATTDPAWRARIAGQIQTRIARAELSYKLALTDLRIDKLLEKSDDLGWIAGLIIDVASTVMLGGIVKGIVALRNASRVALARRITDASIGGEVANDFLLAMEKGVQGLSAEKIIGGVTAAVGMGKIAAQAKALERQNAVQTDRKAAMVAYIDDMKDSATIAFQFVSENVTDGVGDRELLALWESFEANHHLPSIYKARLGETLARFEASDIKRIGRGAKQETVDGKPGAMQTGRTADQDIRVVWVRYTSGAPRELWFQSATRTRDMTIDSGNEAFGKRRVHDGRGAADGQEGEHGLHAHVPDEFAEAAIKRNREAWGGEPEVIMVDESSWDHMPERQKKARENMAKQRGVLDQATHGVVR